MSAPVAPESRPEPILVPGQPAPVAAPEQATVPDTPSTNALSDAFANLAAGLTADTVRPSVPATPAPGAPPVAPAAPPAAPAPVVDAQGKLHDPVTGEYLPASEQPPETPAGDEPPPPAEASSEVGEEPIDPALVVQLMPRHADQAPLDIVVDSPETAERLRQSLNGAIRREQLDAALLEIEQREQDVERLELGLMVDPVRVVTDVLRPEQLDQLLLVLLTDETVYARMGETLERLHDQTSRRELRLDARESYTNTRQQQEGQIQQQRAVQQNIRQINKALNAITPEHLSPAHADMWRRDCMRDLSAITKQHNINALDPMMIPTALKARLVATGVDPDGAVEKIAKAVYGRSGSRTAQPRAAAPSALPAAPAAGTPTPGSRPVATLKAAHERRAAAAATAGPGTGTPTAGGLPALPTGAGLDEALQLVRSRIPATR